MGVPAPAAPCFASGPPSHSLGHSRPRAPQEVGDVIPRRILATVLAAVFLKGFTEAIGLAADALLRLADLTGESAGKADNSSFGCDVVDPARTAV